MRAILWSDATAKRKAAHVALALLLWASGTVLAPPAVQANDTVCGVTGSTSFSFLTGGTYDNVVVPEDASCFIQFADIRGNVKALPDAHVFILASVVGGNVIGDKADTVQVTSGAISVPPFTPVRSTVHGDIHIKEGGPNLRTGHDEVLVCGVNLPNGDILVQKMRIQNGLLVTGSFCQPGRNDVRNGTVTVEDNHSLAGRWSVDRNVIANGNLHVFKNTGTPTVQVFPTDLLGAKIVNFNDVITGDIQCYENSPPFVGGPNTGRAPNQPPFMMPPLSGDNQCFGTSS